MLTCPKCLGLMVIERVSDFWRPLRVARCIQCGAITDQLILKHRQAGLAKGVEMPKFQSEEYRAKWIASLKRNNAAKRKKENDPVVEDLAVPVATNGNGHEPDWMVKTLGILYDRRSSIQKQLESDMQKVEAAIQAVKAMVKVE